MSVRAAVLERIQVGVEGTPGTGVTCNKRLMGLDSLTITPVMGKNFHRAAGTEVPTGESRQKEYTTFQYSGPGCYKALAYLLSAMLKDQTGSPYTYTPLANDLDSIKTLTIETGSALRGERVAYGVVSSFKLRATKEDVAVSGGGFARALQLNQTLNTSATEIGPVLIDPDSVNVSLGTSLGSVAAVKHLEYELDLPERWKPFLPLDASTNSFSEPVKVASEPSLTITLEHMADADALIAAARAKTPYYVVMQATSDTSPYDLVITACCMVEMPSRAANDDVFAATFKLRPFPASDVGSGSWLSIVLTNGMSL